MTRKFGLNHRLSLGSNVDSEAIIIESPFTVAFEISRSTMGTLNSANFKINGLGLKTHSQIFQDRFNPKKYKPIVFQAGYNQLATLFAGNIFQAYTYRQGPDIITYIDARDGGFDTTNTLTTKTFQKGTNLKDLLIDLVNGFPNLTLGKIGNVEGDIKRPAVINGNSFGVIKRYSNDRAFIDLEIVNILNDDEVIEGDVPLISSDSGLLKTPQRNDAFLTVETIFEPRIIMGQVIEIKSDILPQYNGQYKVIGLKHSGTISESVSSQVKSTFNLLIGSQLKEGFNIVQ